MGSCQPADGRAIREIKQKVCIAVACLCKLRCTLVKVQASHGVATQRIDPFDRTTTERERLLSQPDEDLD